MVYVLQTKPNQTKPNQTKITPIIVVLYLIVHKTPFPEKMPGKAFFVFGIEKTRSAGVVPSWRGLGGWTSPAIGQSQWIGITS